MRPQNIRSPIQVRSSKKGEDCKEYQIAPPRSCLNVVPSCSCTVYNQSPEINRFQFVNQRCIHSPMLYISVLHTFSPFPFLLLSRMFLLFRCRQKRSIYLPYSPQGKTLFEFSSSQLYLMRTESNKNRHQYSY